ncbi:RES domain-containing protein [Acidobacteria bacterium AB60]|nr:RES domain-containing protein [Acidobacteria bacterium AB60]
MVFWRISRHRDLTGTGGLRASGRWHYAGRAIVYFSDSPASSLLEVCVHTSANDVPPEFTLLKIEGPEIDVPSVRTDELPDDWHARLEVTRDLGSAWLERNDSVLLRVPSVIVPETMNYLFNPSHPDAAKFRIVEAIAYPFDPRIKL